MHVENILRTLSQASLENYAEGIDWYANAHDLAQSLSDSPGMGAGVIAALSPQKSWQENIKLAEQAFADGLASGTVSDATRKANAILSGALPLKMLRGNKVRSFFTCIDDPDHETEVVIDRHAFDIAHGSVTDDKTRKVLDRVGYYGTVQDVYRLAAREAKLSPMQLQAITWTTWREQKNAGHIH
jgi:hypothetical protein